MTSSKVATLRRQDITAAAKTFRWNRQLPKWTVIVEGRELPARPLVLQAAGVLPNDPTNSHQAVKILQDHGFAVKFQGAKSQSNGSSEGELSIDELIASLRGSFKGSGMSAAREREHKIEKDRFAR